MVKNQMSAIEAINDYISVTLPSYLDSGGYDLKYRSFYIFAIGEILKKIEDDPETPPLKIVEGFRDYIVKYGKKRRIIFLIAAFDAATDVIDLFV